MISSRAVQQLLFPDPRPLVERLGCEFFRSLPASPGVYVMRDSQGVPLYIGKAKNLRQRLRAYRVANPGRMKRRHLRLLGSAVAIDLELCVDEEAALAREAELILLHRPRFNRAGTWPAVPRYVVWRMAGDQIEVRVSEQLEDGDGWMGMGPVGSGAAARYRGALMRLLWFVAHPGGSVGEMPFGWIHGRFDERARVEVNPDGERLLTMIQALAAGSAEAMSVAVRSAIDGTCPAFMAELLEKDLERIRRLTTE